MRNYEVVCIFHPDLDETSVNAAVEKINTWITESGGSVNKVDNWGRKRLAYEINKQREGQYFLIDAVLEPSFSSTLDRNLRFLEPLMRHMIVVVE